MLSEVEDKDKKIGENSHEKKPTKNRALLVFIYISIYIY